MKRRSYLWCLLAVALVATPPAGQDEHDHDDHDHEESHENEEHGHEDHDDHSSHAHDDHGVVSLSAAELDEFGVEVTTAAPGHIERRITLPGEIVPNADRLAHIVPRFAGIVTHVRANIGDGVERGQVLAVVESDESLAPFEVTTLLSGTVISKHIALGEAVSRDRDIFVIADLGTVWIDFSVYQRDVTDVAVGQQVRIYVGHERSDTEGVISYVTPIVDERTRTGTARVVVANPKGDWRPGMFVTGRVLIESADVSVAVPQTALHALEDETVVFVETPDGYRPRSVVVGRRGEAYVELLSGLQPGDRYVSRGGFTIKAELGKGSFDHGHSH